MKRLVLGLIVLVISINLFAIESNILEKGIDALQKKNFNKALEFFKKASKEGSAEAPAYIGYMFANGSGVSKDYKKAVKWYKLSAEKGFEYAAYQLGMLYYFEKSVVNYKEAFKWAKISAEAGRRESQIGLAGMYEYGHGTPLNYEKALEWYQTANAICFVGNIYAKQKKYDKAKKILINKPGMCKIFYDKYFN